VRTLGEDANERDGGFVGERDKWKGSARLFAEITKRAGLLVEVDAKLAHSFCRCVSETFVRMCSLRRLRLRSKGGSRVVDVIGTESEGDTVTVRGIESWIREMELWER